MEMGTFNLDFQRVTAGIPGMLPALSDDERFDEDLVDEGAVITWLQEGITLIPHTPTMVSVCALTSILGMTSATRMVGCPVSIQMTPCMIHS